MDNFSRTPLKSDRLLPVGTVAVAGGSGLVEEGAEEEEEGLVEVVVCVGEEYSNFFFRSSANFATCIYSDDKRCIQSCQVHVIEVMLLAVPLNH